MTIVRTCGGVARTQIHNLINFAQGNSVSAVPLAGRTLDDDDLLIAADWLKKPDRWSDSSIVAEFEKGFATWNGSRFAYAFYAGRTALSACINAIGLKPGEEVLIPGYTCVVVANAFENAKIKLKYCDIELDTYGPRVEDFKRKITDKTRAVYIQHLYGLVCRDYEDIVQFAREHNLFIIEDCCHSTGAKFKGQRIGNFGDVAFYSTEKSKIMNTIMGGIAVTNDARIAAGLCNYKSKCALPSYQETTILLKNVPWLYYKYKHKHRWWRGDLADILYHQFKHESTTVTEISGARPARLDGLMAAPIAALALNQLRKTDDYNQRRRETANSWNAWCSANDYPTAVVIPESEPVFLRYPTRVEPDKKIDTGWARQRLGVELGVWYVSHLHPAPGRIDGCPNADIAVRQCVNFPTILND